MIRPTCCLLATLCLLGAVAPSAAADEEPQKHQLRYQFHPGETIRWKVTHQATVRTTISGTTQTAESVSISVKAWRVTDVHPDGTATFEHRVDSVDMRQKFTGRQEIRYNSETDKEAPMGFQTVAKSVGVPLTIVTMDSQGKIVKRHRIVTSPGDKDDSPMAIPLPEEAVAIGHVWSELGDVDVPLEGGGIKKVKTRRAFTLKEVKDGVATIEVATNILTPNLPPAVEAKLVEQETAGDVKLDIESGRIVDQQMDLDKRVIGFRGDASSLHYLTRFTEKLLPDRPATAKRPEPEAPAEK